MGRTGRLAAGLLVAASSAMAVMPQAASSNVMGIFCLLSTQKIFVQLPIFLIASSAHLFLTCKKNAVTFDAQVHMPYKTEIKISVYGGHTYMHVFILQSHNHPYILVIRQDDTCKRNLSCSCSRQMFCVD